MKTFGRLLFATALSLSVSPAIAGDVVSSEYVFPDGSAEVCRGELGLGYVDMSVSCRTVSREHRLNNLENYTKELRALNSCADLAFLAKEVRPGDSDYSGHALSTCLGRDPFAGKANSPQKMGTAWELGCDGVPTDRAVSLLAPLRTLDKCPGLPALVKSGKLPTPFKLTF